MFLIRLFLYIGINCSNTKLSNYAVKAITIKESVIFTLGKGTTHCTNGIVVQRRPLTCALPPNVDQNEKRPKKRSVTHISTDVLPYHSGRREGPTAININLNQVTLTIPGTTQKARQMDFGWLLCRQPLQDSMFTICDDQRQIIPAWTGFNTKLQQEEIPRECSVGYCPVIESSPTELPTVYTILQRSIQMADQLGQRDVIVVFDLIRLSVLF